MTTIVGTLWLHLDAVLSAFAEKLELLEPPLLWDLGRTANEAFLPRGYLAFERSADGNEVAIIVDIQNDDRQMIISSDACTDSGRVVATGPTAAIQLSESESCIEAALYHWLLEFERFLSSSESEVVMAVSQLA